MIDTPSDIVQAVRDFVSTILRRKAADAETIEFLSAKKKRTCRGLYDFKNR